MTVSKCRSMDRRRTLPLEELVGMTGTTGRTELGMRSFAVAFLSRLGSKVAVGVARVSEREGKREGAPVCPTVDPRRDEMCVHGSVRSPIETGHAKGIALLVTGERSDQQRIQDAPAVTSIV
jgi:hypothetical protein